MVPESIRKAGPFHGAGQTQFDFDFYMISPDDVVVIVADSDDNESTLAKEKYTCALYPDQNTTPGGRVTLKTALAVGQKLAICSGVPNTQNLNLTMYGNFNPTSINKEEDRRVIQIQQIAEQMRRCLIVPLTSEKTPQEVMSDLLDVANKANEYAKKAEAIYNETRGLRDYVSNAWSAIEQAKAQIDVMKSAIDAALARHEEILASWEQIGHGVEEIVPHLDDIKANALHIDEIHRVGQDLQGVDSDTLDCGWVNEPTDKICSVKDGYIKKVAEHIDDCVHPLAESIEDVHALASRADDLSTIASDLNGTSLPGLDLGWVNEGTENIAGVEGGYIKTVIGIGEDIAKVGAVADEVKNVSDNLPAIETAQGFIDKLNEVNDSLDSKVAQVEEANRQAGFSFRYAANAQAGELPISEITPQVNVKAGDHVLNADGALFDIVDLTETTATLGLSLTCLKGDKGDQGASLTLKGRFDTVAELEEADPQGSIGDAYIVGRNIYFWSDTSLSWVDGGEFCGPKGDTGTTPSISVSAETLAEDAEASVIKTGTDEAPHFEFGIPKGITPKISVVTQVLEDGDAPSVSRDGTDAEPIFTFGLPKAFTLPDSGVTPGAYGPRADASGHGAQIQIPEITVDSQGRITGVNVRTLTVPAAQTSVSGNAGTATRLATARAIAVSGAVTGSANFDGSGNITISTTLQNIDLGGL